MKIGKTISNKTGKAASKKPPKGFIFVGGSKAHRRKGYDVDDYDMPKSQNVFRVPMHFRKARRTNAQIAKSKSTSKSRGSKKP